jgi:ABC-type transporter MlaC component
MLDRWGKRPVLAAAAVMLAVAFGLAEAADAADEPPDVFVAILADQVIAALRAPAATERERLRRVDVLTAGAFDLERTARIALGRYWKAAAQDDGASSPICSRPTS